MSDFIRVHGDDPYYKGRKLHIYVPIRSVQKIAPIYAERQTDGQYYRCTPDHKGAEVVSYELTDLNSKSYLCGDRKELEKLGIVEPEPRGRIGFLKQEGGEEFEVDLRDR